ncbi:hypothetical protein B566_EDAN018428 [Ephemera danica]|nr:hypothetical protein B566_EDAN018428 [Ephemera danica]
MFTGPWAMRFSITFVLLFVVARVQVSSSYAVIRDGNYRQQNEKITKSNPKRNCSDGPIEVFVRSSDLKILQNGQSQNVVYPSYVKLQLCDVNGQDDIKLYAGQCGTNSSCKPLEIKLETLS